MRDDVLERVASGLPLAKEGYVRVGVDGADGSGKTWFANELADGLTDSGRLVVRASIDDFHQVSDVRYRRGRLSPEGFYRDSFNVDLFRAYLLDPFGPGGEGCSCTETVSTKPGTYRCGSKSRSA